MGIRDGLDSVFGWHMVRVAGMLVMGPLTVWLESSSIACLPSISRPDPSFLARAASRRATARGCGEEEEGRRARTD